MTSAPSPPAKVPPATIAAAGVALYGADWKSALARDLGVNRRTLTYWMTGGATPAGVRHPGAPPAVRDELRDLLLARARTIADLLARFDQA
jgi:transposase-like protein